MKRLISRCFLAALLMIGGAARAQTSVPVQLISKGAVWKYLDNGSNQGTAWREPAYDDSIWASGPAKLGYGDEDVVTVIGYGPDSANKYITSYFRRTIAVSNPALISNLTLNLRRDDGAVIYVNGVEAGRSNMPADMVTSTTLASLALSGTDETEFIPFSVNPSLLVPGLNVIAVEVHQSNASSTDVGFDLELIADTSPTGNAAPSVTLTAPPANAVFAAPGPINLTAAASDADGMVAKVVFYNGSQKIGESTAAPYVFSWSNVGPGIYTLRAAAIDNSGAATVSDPVSVTVSADGAQPGSGSLTRGPYLQKASSNRMTIRWRSSGNIAGQVRYGAAPNNLTMTVNEPSARTEHEIELTNLSPGTVYYYSVGSSVDTLAGGDANYSFKTYPVAGTPTSARFWVLGDCGRANADQQSVRDAFYNFTGARTPDATLLLGDNAYDNGTDIEYQAAVFDMYSAMNRKTPLWSCLGNHETSQETAFVDTYPYFQVFTFPTAGECGGVPSGTEHYYSFDYGNIHVISLDSMTASRSINGAMANWLQSDLASTTARWIIAIFHHPPYSKGSHDSDEEVELTEMRQNILPILEAGGVDLVLSGHSHAYERSYLLDGHYGQSSTLTASMKKNGGDGRESGNGAYVKPLTGPRDHFGAVYTVAGSSGQVSGGALDHPAMYVSLNHLGSLVLDINGNRLDATFLRENGTAPDSFTILKEGTADSDGDGIPDEYEIAHGLDRHNPADASEDLDHDGISNLSEWLLGLAADKPDRYVWTTTRHPQTRNVAIAFPTLPGRNYQVQWSPDLSNWGAASAVYPGDGNIRTVIDDGSVTGTPSSSQAKRFYRIRVSAP